MPWWELVVALFFIVVVLRFPGGLMHLRWVQGAVDLRVIIVEQNLGFVEAVADRLVILDHGEVVLRGAAGSVSRDDIIKHTTV